LITNILITLSNSYQHFYSAWYSIQSENKTVNNLIGHLLFEQSIQSTIDEEKSSAFNAKPQNWLEKW